MIFNNDTGLLVVRLQPIESRLSYKKKSTKNREKKVLFVLGIFSSVKFNDFHFFFVSMLKIHVICDKP